MAVQHNALRSRQRGLSFLGVIFIGVFLVAAFAIGGQSIPVLLEYQAIKKAATKAAREESTVAGIRASFDRAGAIDDISSISGKDLQITKRNDKVVGFLQIRARDCPVRAGLSRLPVSGFRRI